MKSRGIVPKENISCLVIIVLIISVVQYDPIFANTSQFAKQGTTIIGDALIIEPEAGVIYSRNTVKITFDNIEIYCGALWLTLYDNRMFCTKSVYIASKQKIIAKGSGLIVDLISGEGILYKPSNAKLARLDGVMKVGDLNITLANSPPGAAIEDGFNLDEAMRPFRYYRCTKAVIEPGIRLKLKEAVLVIEGADIIELGSLDFSLSQGFRRSGFSLRSLGINNHLGKGITTGYGWLLDSYSFLDLSIGYRDIGDETLLDTDVIFTSSWESWRIKLANRYRMDYFLQPNLQIACPLGEQTRIHSQISYYDDLHLDLDRFHFDLGVESPGWSTSVRYSDLAGYNRNLQLSLGFRLGNLHFQLENALITSYGNAFRVRWDRLDSRFSTTYRGRHFSCRLIYSAGDIKDSSDDFEFVALELQSRSIPIGGSLFSLQVGSTSLLQRYLPSVNNYRGSYSQWLALYAPSIPLGDKTFLLPKAQLSGLQVEGMNGSTIISSSLALYRYLVNNTHIALRHSYSFIADNSSAWLTYGKASQFMEALLAIAPNDGYSFDVRYLQSLTDGEAESLRCSAQIRLIRDWRIEFENLYNFELDDFYASRLLVSKTIRNGYLGGGYDFLRNEYYLLLSQVL